MRWSLRQALILTSALFALGAPAPVAASCASGAAPDYADVVAVEALRFNLVGKPRPGFQLSVGRYDPKKNGSSNVRYAASLKLLKKNMFLPPGLYKPADPQLIYDRRDFAPETARLFRHSPQTRGCCLHRRTRRYIAVSRCGTLSVVGAVFPVTRTLGALERGIDFDDPQWLAFSNLLDDIQAAAFATPWSPQPAPTP